MKNECETPELWLSMSPCANEKHNFSESNLLLFGSDQYMTILLRISTLSSKIPRRYLNTHLIHCVDEFVLSKMTLIVLVVFHK
jgi:hypothetical protein